MLKELAMRGAMSVLYSAESHIAANPWESGYACPEIDKYGNADSVNEALNILKRARIKVRDELTNGK